MPFLVVDYDATWPKQFEEEKEHIVSVASEYIEAIEHFGSTSIPGMCAKPKIDILIGLQDLALVEHCIEPFRRLNYTYGGEIGPERYYFRKPIARELGATHHLHLVQFGSLEWAQPLLFRDYLRTHPMTAREYGLLKKRLMTQFGRYSSEDKSTFIQSVLRESQAEKG